MSSDESLRPFLEQLGRAKGYQGRREPTLQGVLRRVPLLPGESLWSFLKRTAHANSYESPTMLLTLCADYLKVLDVTDKWDKQLIPTTAETFEALAVLTGLSPLEIYHATPHHLAEVLTTPGVLFETVQFSDGTIHPLIGAGTPPKHFRNYKAAAYCPSCLGQIPHHRLAWRVFTVSACPDHRCLLLDSCLACGQRVSVDDVVDAQCGKCGANLATMTSASLADDDLGLRSQAFLQAYLDGIEVRSLFGSTRIPDVSLQALYRFLDGLHRRLILKSSTLSAVYLHKYPEETQFAPGTTRESLTMPQNYVTFAMAFNIISGWPDSFYEFLDAYYGDSIQRPGPIFVYDLWAQDLWQGPKFQFIRSAFNDYLDQKHALRKNL